MRITFLSPALEEITKAVEYYESQAPGLGEDLDRDIERTLGFLSHNPDLGSPFESQTRRALLRRFPFGLVYRVAKDRIVLIALIHLRREPGYWKDRV